MSDETDRLPSITNQTRGPHCQTPRSDPAALVALVALALLPLLALTACDGIKHGGYDEDSGGPATGGDTGVSCAGGVQPTCSGQATNVLMNGYVELVSMCVEGLGVAAAPDIEVVVPSVFGDYLGTQTAQDYDPSTCAYWASISNGVPYSPLVNDDSANGDRRFWDWEIVPGTPCGHDVQQVSWWRIEPNGNIGYWPFGASCPMNIQPPPAFPPGQVPSGGQPCVAGSATFDLMAHSSPQGSATQSLVRWTPVARDAVQVPERAWLSALKVQSWGDVDNLHISKEDFGLLVYNGPELQGTEVLTSEMPSAQFATKSQPFTTVLGSEGVDVSKGAVEGPAVTLTWTCEADLKAPGYASPVGFTGHVGTIPETYGVQHRFVVWLNPEGSEIRLALEGRFADAFVGELEASAALKGGYLFSVEIPLYGAAVSGTLVPEGESFVLSEVVAKVGKVDLPIDGVSLTALALP